MASKKEAPKKMEQKKSSVSKLTPEEKAAKRKARMEALKNRPKEQRPNGKQMDIIRVDENNEIRKYAAPIKVHGRSIGVAVTTVALVKGQVVSVAEAFIPGELMVKVKNGHGNIVAQKASKSKKGEEIDEEEEETED